MRRYRHDFDDAAHVALLTLPESQHCQVMISGCPSRLFETHLGDWRSMSPQVKDRAAVATETVWPNFEPDHLLRTRFTSKDARPNLQTGDNLRRTVVEETVAEKACRAYQSGFDPVGRERRADAKVKKCPVKGPDQGPDPRRQALPAEVRCQPPGFRRQPARRPHAVPAPGRPESRHCPALGVQRARQVQLRRPKCPLLHIHLEPTIKVPGHAGARRSGRAFMLTPPTSR